VQSLAVGLSIGAVVVEYAQLALVQQILTGLSAAAAGLLTGSSRRLRSGQSERVDDRQGVRQLFRRAANCAWAKHDPNDELH
jgi:hypothetical protein